MGCAGAQRGADVARERQAAPGPHLGAEEVAVLLGPADGGAVPGRVVEGTPAGPGRGGGPGTSTERNGKACLSHASC